MPEYIFPNEGGTLANDELAIVTDDDVMQILPAYMRASDAAPVRDAIVAALRVMATTYQEAVTYAAAQRDVINASGDELDSMLPVRRREGELDEDYRTRGLGLREVVSPEAICAAVNSLISPLTCVYIEPELDQLFLFDDFIDPTFFISDIATWASFLDVASSYPDRYYSDDSALNGGAVMPSRNPGPAGVFDAGQGRYFVLSIPDLAKVDAAINLVFNGQKFVPSDPAVPELGGCQHPTTPTDPDSISGANGGTGTFAMTGSAVNANRNFTFSATTSSALLYNAIIDVVERLRGGGFSWVLTVQA